MNSTYVLITNLSYVTVGSVRTMTHALLLCAEPSPFDRGNLRYQARGFGTEAAWPVFDLELPSIEYTLTDPQDFGVFVGTGTARPLFSCAMLRIKDGPDILLTIDDYRRPIDIEHFEFDREIDDEIGDVWRALAAKVADYWHAPHMPGLVWGPPAQIGPRAVRRVF